MCGGLPVLPSRNKSMRLRWTVLGDRPAATRGVAGVVQRQPAAALKLFGVEATVGQPANRGLLHIHPCSTQLPPAVPLPTTRLQGAAINKSLSHLGTVINKLSEGVQEAGTGWAFAAG